MSVIGVDFGNVNCVIARAQRGGVDIIANEVSNRQTPAIVSFCGGNERHTGEHAANMQMQHLRHTVQEVKRVLGRSLDEEEVAGVEAARALHRLVPEQQPETSSSDSAAATARRARRAAVEVRYSAKQLGARAFSSWHLPPAEREKKNKSTSGGNEIEQQRDVHVLPAESIAGMLLHHLSATASAASSGAPARDMVVAVPMWYTDAQRAALLDAGAIGGVRILRLINEHYAAALSYGLYRAPELPEAGKPPTVTVIADVGHSQTTVAVVAFWRTRMQVLSVVYDRNVGGRDFDAALAEHFAAEFRQRYKLDVRENRKASMRLRTQCEKVKKMLSANAQAPLNIECFMNDVDVSAMVERSQFEELAAPLAARIASAARDALAQAQLPEGSAINILEVIGGSTRVPMVQAALESATSLSARRTMNAEECIARGCALQAAMVTPGFKVREYAGADVLAFPVVMAKEKEVQVFAAQSAVPSLKQVTYAYTGKPLHLRLYYGETPLLPAGSDRHIASVEVGPAPGVKHEVHGGKIRVKVRVDVDGMVSVPGAQLVESEPAAESAPGVADGSDEAATETEPAAAAATNTSSNAGAEQEAMRDAGDEESGNQNNNDNHGGAAAAATKRAVKKTDLPVTVLGGSRLPSYAIDALVEIEAQMQAADRYRAERADALNALESYVYDMRSRIDEYGEWAEYATDEERAAFRKLLDAAEEWIYSDDAEEAGKSKFTERLADLRKRHGDRLATRVREAEERAQAARQFSDALAGLKAEAGTGADDERFGHIGEEEKRGVLQAAADADRWLHDSMAAVEVAGKAKDPAVTVEQMRARQREVVRRARKVLDQPRPVAEEEERDGGGAVKKAEAEDGADERGPTSGTEPEGKVEREEREEEEEEGMEDAQGDDNDGRGGAGDADGGAAR